MITGKGSKESRVLAGLGALATGWTVILWTWVGSQQESWVQRGVGDLAPVLKHMPPIRWKKHGELNDIKLVTIPSQCLQLREGRIAPPPSQEWGRGRPSGTGAGGRSGAHRFPPMHVCLTMLPLLKGHGALQSPKQVSLEGVLLLFAIQMCNIACQIYQGQNKIFWEFLKTLTQTYWEG